jgi:hypothetical protein
MKRRPASGAAKLIVVLAICGTAMAQSFKPGEVWLDDRGVAINAHGGGILLDRGTYYWFGEHKTEGEAGNFAHVGVHVYSSTDLYHWSDRGIALHVSHDPGSEITDGCVLERPKVIRNPGGRYVMWFHLELKGHGYRAARAGVAVSDSPVGPYEYLGSFRPNGGVWPQNVPEEEKHELTPDEMRLVREARFNGAALPDDIGNELFRRDFAGGQMSRDMTLFVDDDGAGYQIYASEENSTMQISLLSSDYLRPAGKYIRVFPGGFNEAPAMFKHGGKYYLITSGTHGWAPCDARLGVADSIWGPWKAMGNPCVGPAEQTRVTFDSQSTYVLPVKGGFIFMADRWRPKNAIDGRYVWLPIAFEGERPRIGWVGKWDLSVFEK